ncbi:regulatory protein YcgZ [Tatumella saanichensis]|uniref:regulatory protein YcgZ n=1 Tax=Tatumella saanichensis TaxID=480813 RepID=UPI0004A33611|nr:regulatory protein YcgZ [Tatumella saanichensis]
MRQNSISQGSAAEIIHYFNAEELSGEETFGEIVLEILASGKNINRKAICQALLSRLNQATSVEQTQHYQHLISLVLTD